MEGRGVHQMCGGERAFRFLSPPCFDTQAKCTHIETGRGGGRRERAFRFDTRTKDLHPDRGGAGEGGRGGDWTIWTDTRICILGARGKTL